MLVLSRKEAQRIRVGDSIVVTVVKIAGDKVRVGIEAPSDVLVLRDELEAWDEPAAAPRCDGRPAAAAPALSATGAGPLAGHLRQTA
ncbi:MAG: carbon storage regulator [Planctomycetota bacterium]